MKTWGGENEAGRAGRLHYRSANKDRGEAGGLTGRGRSVNIGPSGRGNLRPHTRGHETPPPPPSFLFILYIFVLTFYLQLVNSR